MHKKQLWLWMGIAGLAMEASSIVLADQESGPPNYYICAGDHNYWDEAQQACLCTQGTTRSINGIDCEYSDPWTGGGGISGGGTGGTSGMPTSGSGTGGTGGSGGQSMPPVDCSLCQPGHSMIIADGQPSQCTDSTSAGCQARCLALADIQQENCSRWANNTGFGCTALMYTLLGSYCTQTVNGGIPYSTSDVSFWDVQGYATRICPSGSYWSNPWLGISANDTCRADIATVKTSEERSDCRDQLINGSGSYFQSAKFSFEVGIPGAKVSGEIGHADASGQSGAQFCESITRRMAGQCAQADSCNRAHCPETPGAGGKYQDGSSCANPYALPGGGGAQ